MTGGSPILSPVWPQGAGGLGVLPFSPYVLPFPLVKCDELPVFHILKVFRALCSRHVPKKQIFNMPLGGICP